MLTHLKTILSPAVKYSSRNRVDLPDNDDDPNDRDWSPVIGDSQPGKRAAAAKKQPLKTKTAKKTIPSESRAGSPAVIELDCVSREPSPLRSDSLPLTRSRKSKTEHSPVDEQQQMVIYQGDRQIKKMRTQDFALQLQLHESESERRLATVEHEHKMSELQARLTQMEMEKRMAILEVEKRASDERATLLMTVNDKELALKQKEIDLLREKEGFLTDKCKFMASRAVDVPLTAAFGPQSLMTNNNNAMVIARHPFAQFQPQQQLQLMEVEQAPMRPVEAAPQPMDPERVALHKQVHPFVNCQGRFNLSVTAPDFYDLRDILSKVITTNQNGAPLSDEDESLLRSGLLNDYRIFLRHNNDATAPIEEREKQLFALDSDDNRINCSNILLHYAFVRKAREFNCITKPNKKTGQLETKHTIEVTDELRFSYGQECCSLWFPKLTHGVNTIVSESLRFFALSHKSGAGDGKICPFCCKNYINYSSGNIKNMHQLTGCDVLANLSQNERVILEKVLAQRAASSDFATHKLIAQYSEQSLLRKATAREIEAKHYVRCKLTGDKLRLNMPVFMQLRADTWEEFLQRLNAFSTSKTSLYNLHAQPFARMIDALCIDRPMTRPPAKLPSLAARPAPKKVVPPKPRPSQMSEQQKEEAKQRERISRCKNTFLGKVLLNHRGENYLANLPLRDFRIDDETGFGDGMFFETAAEQEVRERRDRRMAEMDKKNGAAQPVPPSFVPPLGQFDFSFAFPMNPMGFQLPQQQPLSNLFAPLPRADTVPPAQPQRQQEQQTSDTNEMDVVENINDNNNEAWSLTAGDPLAGDTQSLSFDEHGTGDFNLYSQYGQASSLFGTPTNYDPFASQFQNGFGSQ